MHIWVRAFPMAWKDRKQVGAVWKWWGGTMVPVGPKWVWVSKWVVLGCRNWVGVVECVTHHTKADGCCCAKNGWGVGKGWHGTKPGGGGSKTGVGGLKINVLTVTPGICQRSTAIVFVNVNCWVSLSEWTAYVIDAWMIWLYDHVTMLRCKQNL
jgi:hypothetical protein